MNNIPLEAQFYIDIYTKLAQHIYHNKKTFDINSNKSYAYFTLNINGKQYKIKSNLVQYSIINKLITT